MIVGGIFRRLIQKAEGHSPVGNAVEPVSGNSPMDGQERSGNSSHSVGVPSPPDDFRQSGFKTAMVPKPDVHREGHRMIGISCDAWPRPKLSAS